MTTEQKFNCIFCKDVFDNKEELQVHFRKHGDPHFKSKIQHGSDSLVSKMCDKKKTEMVSCDVCSQQFATISKAITHKHKVHPDHDVKYFCPWCGKLFTMKHPYNIHLQSNHDKDTQTDDKIFHCDCCDVDFFLTSAMMYHNKFFHRQDSDIPDIGTSKKMKLYQNQDIIQIYYCPFCGEEYENKVNLYKHVSDDHSDENQSPEEVLRCPLCEAIFYHLDAYEIHLYFHTVDDLYSGTNNLMSQVTDFSLETVPPFIEQVEKEEYDMEAQSQDADVESSVNAVGIENFLELAMGASEDSNSGKTKKKKHKKSKKPAITLNEFLSMNQDVFGEDLDFHGAEEVPTRVVAKQFKNNRKSTNSATSAELEKLKSKGIVVMKVGASKPTKNIPKKAVKKALPNMELKTSSELLTKLINQSNKQIKVVKKSVPNIAKNESEQETKDKINEAPYTSEGKFTQSPKETESQIDADKKITEEMYSNTPKLASPNEGAYKIPLPYIEECSSTTNSINTDANINPSKSSKWTHNDDENEDDMNITSTNTSNINDTEQYSDDDNIPKREDNENVGSNINDILDSKYEEYQENSELNDKERHEDLNNEEDINEDIDDTPNSNIKNSPPVVSSLSTLKHLSHITVKPLNQNKIASSEHTSNDAPQTNNEKPLVEKDVEPSTSLTVSTRTGQQQQTNCVKTKALVNKDSTLDALKILSKNITVKSLTSTQKCIGESGSDDNNETYRVIDKPSTAIKIKDGSVNQNITKQKIKIEKNEPVAVYKVPNSSNTPKKITHSIKNCEAELKPTDIDSNQSSVLATNTDILKRLPNVVTKTPTKIVQPQIMKQNYLSVKTIETKHKEQEVIEISDFEDSEDETDINSKQPDIKQESAVDPLKNLSKHITVKSLNHSAISVQKNIKVEEPDYNDDVNQHDSFDFDNVGTSTEMKVCSQKISSKNVAFKNVLKNLGKNITVKSQNSVPSPIVNSQDYNSEDMGADDDHDYDSDTDIGKVKITEIDEQHSSHDETLYNSDEGLNNNAPIIESPHDSCNEQDEGDEKEFDFESQIKCNKVEKNTQEISTNKNTMCLNNLMNISKNITIKSLNSKPVDKQDQPSTLQESLEVSKFQPKQTPTKSPKPSGKESINENITNRSNKSIVDHTTNNALDQKVSVNKEVTVKTFQTKTVIQEITTTVTKTIKTVNQTVKQETRNTGQVNIPVLPQKVQGMRPSTSKNLQGVVIRHAAPIAKTSNTVAQIRPSGPVVRPSKQIVPMRPGLNTRPKTPRMPSVKPNLQTPSPNKQVIGRPLKFSPSAITQTIAKRPNTDDASGGPFSCFKKPKESLIPVSDIPTFGGEDSVKINAASHTSSNYMSTSKIVKGNSVMTATQMKSEVTSMQQFSRTNKVSAIKVKTAQSKQIPVQEKSESNTMKHTTLQAIEKLQKQGLLIKKPRIEENDNSSNDADDNLGNSSADEHFE